MGWHSTSVHRLDQLVSGLLILARSAPKADFFRQQIEAVLVQKQYIAKVVGEFPEDKQVVDANINYNAREGRSTAEIKDSAKGKAACTKFTRISSNGTYSIVLCEAITARTHQIRVHLQYLGHPIANDVLYLSAETVDRSSKGSSADRSVLVSDASLRPSSDEEVLHKSEGDSKADFSVDPMCTKCPNFAPKGYEALKKVYGYIVFGTLDLHGLMNAPIQIGQNLADQSTFVLIFTFFFGKILLTIVPHILKLEMNGYFSRNVIIILIFV